jgi:hypothetical protein
MVEHHAFPGETVDVGRDGSGVAVTAHPGRKVIGNEKKDVGRRGFGCTEHGWTRQEQ